MINAAYHGLRGGLRLVLVHEAELKKEDRIAWWLIYVRRLRTRLAPGGRQLPPVIRYGRPRRTQAQWPEYAAPRRAKFYKWVVKQGARLSIVLGSEETCHLVERMGASAPECCASSRSFSVRGPGPVRWPTSTVRARARSRPACSNHRCAGWGRRRHRLQPAGRAYAAGVKTRRGCSWVCGASRNWCA